MSLVLTIVGCAESEPFVAEPPPVPVERAALGFIDVRDAVVTPWCSGTLIAPDVVLTSARCVEGLHPTQIRFGIGAATPNGAQGGLFPVDRVLLNSDRGARAHNLAALILARPIANVTPVAMGPDMLGTEPQRLESVTYSYVARGEGSLRSVWGGDAQPTGDSLMVVPSDGKPSCECVSGAGMVDEAGRLLGLVSAGVPTADGVPFCSGAFSLATVAHNQEFVHKALAASATTVPVVP